MSVEELLGELILDATPDARATRVTGVATDSRRVRGGELFVAVRGEAVDGHDFVRAALESGARAVAVEREIPLPGNAKRVRVASGRDSVARAADRIFGSPSRALFVAGITGTNGKTTVSYLTRAILEASGRPTALLGTVEYAWPGTRRPATHTTPDALVLQSLLREAVDAGARAAVMEVSSHGLAQERVREIAFDVALFTNLSRDHLDYHGDMRRYRDAKASFFRADLPYGEGRTAVLNLDDPVGREIARETTLPVIGFAVRERADVRAEVRRADLAGLELRLHLSGEHRDLRLAMPGLVNASNAAAAAAAALVAGIGIDDIATGLAGVEGVPGRTQAVAAGQPFGVLVDFAHTPDALERLLEGLRKVTPGRLIVVFGCGGDRDRGKRPVMGEIAGRLADRVIVTSDNPRSEEPRGIAEAIVAGSRGPAVPEVELDRARAIRRAVGEAAPGDLVVIAGKGHERVQVIGGERRAFDDAAVARESLAELGYIRD